MTRKGAPLLGAGNETGRRGQVTAAGPLLRSPPARLSCTAVMLLAVLASVSSAQTTTGRLIGRAVDEGGVPLADVDVTIDSPVLIGGAQTKATDARGELVFLSLPPGDYEVRAALAGYIPQELSGVKVPLGGAAAVTITMAVGSFSEEIGVISEAPVVDPTQVNTGQVFRLEYMQSSAIGSVNRAYNTVVNQTAGVAGGGSWRGIDQPRVFGSTIGENVYFIDGIDATEPVTNVTYAKLNFDAIAEIEFQTGGFEAEHGRATGGLLNVVTKSGGNRFSGTFDARYREDTFQESGEFFDARELSTSYRNLGATLGGPIAKDKAWFFASYQRIEDEDTPVEAPTTSLAKGNNVLGKITWQIKPAWRLTSKVSLDPNTWDNANSSRWTKPEATVRTETGTTITSGELTALLSDSLLWNTRLGSYNYYNDEFPQSGNLSAIGHYNLDTGLRTGNYGNQQYWESSRTDLATDITWFVDDVGGSHEVKGGIEYSPMDMPEMFCTTGTPNGERCVDDGVGFYFNDIEPGGTLPWVMYEDRTSGPARYDGTISTAFVQDAWRPSPDVNLKLGVRYDAVSYDTFGGIQIADMDMVQPRVGVAWDITGNAKNVLRGNWGRFLHPNGLSLPAWVKPVVEPLFIWYSCSGVLPRALGIRVGSVDECAAVAADLGWNHRLDHEGWDPYGWVLEPSQVRASEPSRTDPGIRAAYADQWILAFERDLGRRSAVELAFVDKKTRDIVDDTCNGNWPTPSADAACDYYLLANLPGLRRDYRGLTLRFETRRLDWLTVLASYTYSTSKGNVEYTQNVGGVFDFYPWHFENRYGYLSDHRRHRFKLNGFLTLRGDWTVAFDGYWSSPVTWAPYENRGDNFALPGGVHYLEPAGNREASSSYQLDLQLAKGFTLGRTRLALIGSVFNVFGSEEPTAVCSHIGGCGFYEDGSPIDMASATVWQRPRRYEVGLRVEF